MEDEERIVAKRRVYDLLARFEKDDFKLSDFNPEAELQEPMHIPSQLFSALKHCQQHCIYDMSFKILRYLIENQQVGKQFLWKMFVNFLQKDCAFFLPLVSEFKKVFFKSQKVHHDELLLFHTVLLLNKEMYDKAYQEACNFTARELSIETSYCETAKAASSALLMGYKTILDYRTMDTGDDEMLHVIKESFQLLFTKKTFEPLFAEPYTYILMKLKLQKEAEAFLEKYVEKESKGNFGVSGALHALNIIKLHIPKASPKLTISFLEMIANRDIGNSKILDLCKHYLHTLNSATCSISDNESDCGSDAGLISFAPEPNGLNKCLELIMCFLDVYVKHVPSAVIKEGWSIMAEILKRICLQEAEDCFQSIINLWHNERKKWWPCFRLPHYGLPSTLPPDDAEFYSNKGFVCYVLESQYHPFVVSLMEHQGCHLLKSLMEQLHHAKIKFDSHIEALQTAMEPVIPVPLVSKPIVPQMTVNSPQTQMTPSLSKFNAIDADAIAVEYPKMMATSKMGKNDYIRVGKIHPNTRKLLKLDISNMIAKRYKKRRTIRVQNKSLRMTRAWRSATISTCSVRSFESLDSSLDEWEHGDNNVMTDESLSQDGGNDSTSKWCQPNPCQQTVSMLAKKRWTTFVNHGRWGSFTVDDDESDEYTPPSSDDEDSYSDEFDDEFQDSDGEGDTPEVISNNYPASIPSSYPSVSPASSVSGCFTPVLQFSDFPNPPRDVIPNGDHCRFVEFDSFSVCSNGMKGEIDISVAQAIRKLDMDIHASTYLAEPAEIDHGDEYVVEAEIVIPEEALVQSPNRSASNFNNRSFSRDFEVSSPDMFAFFSEDEDKDIFGEDQEGNRNNDDNHREKMNSTIHQETSSPVASTPYVVSTPLAVSTPITVGTNKNKMKILKSKAKRLRNASQNKTNEQTHSSKRSTPGRKKKSKRRVSKSYRWDISLVDRVLKESLKESLLSQDKSSSTSNFAQLPTVETETATEEEACNQPGTYNHGIVEETLLPIAGPSTVKSSPPKAKRISSIYLPSSSVWASDHVTAPLAVSSPKIVRKRKEEKKVDVKSKKARLENATKNETNQQPTSDSRSSVRKKKSKSGVSESRDWQLALLDRVLKESESLLSEDQPSTSNSKQPTTNETVPPIAVTSTKKKGQNKTKKDINLPSASVSTSDPDPIASKTVRKKKEEKKVDVKSKKVPLRNATRNETNHPSASDSRSSRRKKKSEPGVSESSDWQLALLDRVLKETLTSKEKPSTSKKSKKPLKEKTLRPTAVNSAKQNSKPKKAVAKGNSLGDASAAFDVENVGISLQMKPGDGQSKPRRVTARKCHVRERDPDYLSASEGDSV
ncbi:hypothetical protein DAPPUDRAFT_308906 [Daphnia pulex]|uniref:Uncharacterized protein n=1 Tax=Daphnia pulex TaxID=6669 RepID=E9HA83_DAPPU|nr:hypothetical protein DAPPUDRAFT_308906 [Daphnia pulex]|eukprot:EFX71384.1 hypothetical protein DAPPUDRAFT_308906 [Daphnia pulex]